MNPSPIGERWDWDALLRDALQAGITVLEFWDLTPAELVMVFEAHYERTKRQLEREAWMVWHTAALIRVKRMPALSELLPNTKPRKTREQLAREHDEIKRRLGRG